MKKSQKQAKENGGSVGVKTNIILAFRGWVKTVLPHLAKFYYKNRCKIDRDYPQLWYIWLGKPYWLRRKIKRWIVQPICGMVTGHEISKTEWGYVGGNYIDLNCRWCDKTIKMHCKEAILPKKMEDIIAQSGL